MTQPQLAAHQKDIGFDATVPKRKRIAERAQIQVIVVRVSRKIASRASGLGNRRGCKRSEKKKNDRAVNCRDVTCSW